MMLTLVINFYKQFSVESIEGIVFIIILLACSAIISASETAFFSLSASQLKEIKSRKKETASIAIKLLEKPKSLLATILIANNFVNIAIIIISTFVVNNTFDFSEHLVLGFVFQAIIITSVILLFGEILPKVYATQNAVLLTNVMARTLNILVKIFYPISSLMIKFSSIIDKKISKKNYDISMSYLTDAIEITSDNTTPEEEKKMLRGIIKFGDTDVKEIMKARVDVVAVDVETPYNELISIIYESGYSRIPVYKGSFDNILGVLYIRDILQHLEKNDTFEWPKIIRSAFYVPENKKINDLLQEFRSKKIHMAIVVDEYGGASGLVTLEDVIEEIVGEISDEYDLDNIEQFYTKISENEYIFEGKMLLNDFCKILNIEDRAFLSEKGDSDTIAGLLLEYFGKIPNKNEIITIQKFTFTVDTVDKRRIKRIKVNINEKTFIEPIENTEI